MIVQFNEPQPAPAKCSFCGLQKQHTKKLVQSATDPRHHICDVCVAKATARLATVPNPVKQLEAQP